MDSNQRRFVEDTLDLLNELDEGLLQLEANAHAKAPLEQVFRTLHTIKGGANMFGFENIGTLAHQLETLFDLVRQHAMPVSDKLISITLQSFDKVRDLLKEADLKHIIAPETLQASLNAVQEFHRSVHEGGFANEIHLPSAVQKDELATFLIQITPTINMTEDGNHPLIFIVQDVAALGTSHVKIATNPGGTISAWELFLSTTISREELESYFIFVENECRVTFTKVAAADLFGHPEFTQYLNSLENKPVDLTALERCGALYAGKDLLKSDKNHKEEEADSTGREIPFADTYIKVNKRKIDDLLNRISELIILQAQFTTIAERLNSTELSDTTEQLDLITHQLRDTSLEIGLVPIETLVTRFKRLVRDLSKSLNKKVNFLSEGAETEIDKDVIELLMNPMIHMIRNAIDHGIETPDERRAIGKSEHGTVKLKAFTASSHVHIIISDDGKGINKARVLALAKEKKLVDFDARLSEEEILNLIFHPGLSTSEQLSDISGRGVGMDVVKQKINELRGNISVRSTEGKGTELHLRIPLSRSIIEGMLVKIGASHFIIPLVAVEKCYEIPTAMLSTDNCQKLVLDGMLTPVFYLQEIFHETERRPDVMQVIKISYDEFPVAITVDSIVGEYQTVLKPLGDLYQSQNAFSGATILGNGTVALVFDMDKLIKRLSIQAETPESQNKSLLYETN